MPRRRTTLLSSVGAGLVVARILTSVAVGPPLDLLVYRQGAADLLAGRSIYRNTGGLPFTYPPFAAALAAPLTWAPEGVVAAAWLVGELAAYAIVVLGCARRLGMPRQHVRWWLLGGLLLAPIQRHLGLGQVNLALAALVVLDAWAVPARWRGWLTGLAAGVKVLPGLFLLWHLVRGDRAAATRVALGAALSAVIGWLIAPTDSVRFFTELLWDSHRVGGLTYPDNVSLTGVTARALATNDPSRWLVWGLAGAALAAAAVVARRLARAGDELGGLVCLALGVLLASPVSWSHHWVWLVPAAMWSAARGRRRLTLGWALAGLAEPIWLAEAVTPWPWLGPPWPPLGQLAAALLPLMGVATLIGAWVRTAPKGVGAPGPVDPGSGRLGGRIGLRQHGTEPRGILLALGVRGVGDARPEEAAQAVALGARHDVQVQVRHRLADHIVGCDERALGAQSVDHGSGDELGRRQEGVTQLGRQVGQRRDVGVGHHERVPLEDGPSIQEGDDVLVPPDDAGRDRPRRDRAEQTSSHGNRASHLAWDGMSRVQREAAARTGPRGFDRLRVAPTRT